MRSRRGCALPRGHRCPSYKTAPVDCAADQAAIPRGLESPPYKSSPVRPLRRPARAPGFVGWVLEPTRVHRQFRGSVPEIVDGSDVLIRSRRACALPRGHRCPPYKTAPVDCAADQAVIPRGLESPPYKSNPVRSPCRPARAPGFVGWVLEPTPDHRQLSGSGPEIVGGSDVLMRSRRGCALPRGHRCPSYKTAPVDCAADQAAIPRGRESTPYESKPLRPLRRPARAPSRRPPARSPAPASRSTPAGAARR